MDRIVAIIGSYERAWSLYSSLLKKDIGQADAYLVCMPPDGRTYALFQAAPWDIERMHPIVRLQGVMRAVRAVAGQYAGFAAQQPEPGSSKALAVKAMIEHIGVIEANNALSLVDGQHHEIDTQPALEALKEMAPLAYREYEKRVLQQGSSIADWEQVKQKYPAEAERLNHDWHKACNDRAASRGRLDAERRRSPPWHAWATPEPAEHEPAPVQHTREHVQPAALNGRDVAPMDD